MKSISIASLSFIVALMLVPRPAGAQGLPARVQALEAAAAALDARVSTLEGTENVLLKQQDVVTVFNFATGHGQHVGTVTGIISGTSIVDFQYIPTGPTTIDFDNKVVITDLDGDQLSIRNQGTGRLVVPIDATIFGWGGPLTGTYQVLSGTGKFVSWIGKTYPYRGVSGNPVGGLGTVYAEVLSTVVTP